MCNLVQLEDILIFECPYCGKKHNLTYLMAAKEITQMTSIFLCYARWEEDKFHYSTWEKGKVKGCNKEFVLDLTLSYEVGVRAIEGERERES